MFSTPLFVKKIYKNDIIRSYVGGKTVLDIGFLGPDHIAFSTLHSTIQKHAKNVVGVDINKKRIDALKKKGYDVIHDDAKNLKNTLKTKRKFDVVVAGDLIEHLENPGLFLENIKKLLNKDGVAVLATPNANSMRSFYKHSLGYHGKPPKNSSEKNKREYHSRLISYGHVIFWQKSTFLTLMRRMNFKIIGFYYCNAKFHKENYPFKHLFLANIKSWFSDMVARYFNRWSQTMIAIVKNN
jgi:SAM-dependent methyltransferase